MLGSANFLPQNLQASGLSPVWVRVCRARSEASRQRLPQWVHAYLTGHGGRQRDGGNEESDGEDTRAQGSTTTACVSGRAGERWHDGEKKKERKREDPQQYG